MGKIARFKLVTLVKILLFFSCSCTIRAQVLSPEKNWIVVNDISCWDSNGQWEKEQHCPNSTIVTGHRFRFLSRTGLTGIQLMCSEKYQEEKLESRHILEVISKDEAGINLPGGEWENWTKGSRSAFAEGFSFAPGEMNLRRSVKNFNVIYHSPNPPEMNKQLALNSGKIVIKCPEDHAICGVKGMTDKTGLGILTAIGLRCCFHCVPEEKWVSIHQHNNSGSLYFQGKIHSTVGIQQRHLQTSPSDSANSIASIFGHIKKSSTTEFDWANTPFLTWMGENSVTKAILCKEERYCVYKQLMGQCGNVRVPVDKFCQISVYFAYYFTWEEKTCTDLETIESCSDGLKNLPSPRLTKQLIQPNRSITKMEVLCDFQVDGGGWTLIQKRTSGPRDEFYQNWNEYVAGFGSLDGNFWLGLENIHALTKNDDQELRIELEDFDGNKMYAKYSSFSISDASDFYRLSISGFSPDSTAGDSMTSSVTSSNLINNKMRFTTKDKKNDKLWDDRACGENSGGKGGWWFSNCGVSNLNGPYLPKDGAWGIRWDSWKKLKTLAKSEMKIRKRQARAKNTSFLGRLGF